RPIRSLPHPAAGWAGEPRRGQQHRARPGLRRGALVFRALFVATYTILSLVGAQQTRTAYGDLAPRSVLRGVWNVEEMVVNGTVRPPVFTDETRWRRMVFDARRASGVQMKEKFVIYNLELQEVLIGTPTSGTAGGQIEQILVQLRSRQIAEEQVETYNRQERASVKERELREAESRARQQQALTESEIAITVQSNQGKAEYARAQQQAAQIQTLAQAEAEKIRILAEGEAKKIRLVGEADADRAGRVGVAQALALEEQVRAYGGPQYQLIQNVMGRFAEAIEKSGSDVVPKIQMTSDGKAGGSMVENLLTLLLSGKLGETVGVLPTPAPDPNAETLRSELRRSIQSGNGASA